MSTQQPRRFFDAFRRSFQETQPSGRVIEDLIGSIQRGKVAVFAGAGISYHSGLPLAKDLMAYVLEVLQASENERKRLLEVERPFEAFVQTLSKSSDMSPFFSLFDVGQPNANHLLLARLVRMGKLKTIVTTNFDCLIEKALSREGIEAGRDYQCLYRESDFENQWSTEQCRLIKIHGSVHDQASMAITLEHVASKVLTPFRRQVIEYLFSLAAHDSVLIIGYSSSDLFDLSPAIESIDSRHKKVIYVQHANELRGESLAAQAEKNPFGRFNGSRIFCDTDWLIERIWRSCLSTEFQFVNSTTLWRESVDQWHAQACAQHSAGIRHTILGYLFSYSGASHEALSHFQLALKHVKQLDNRFEEYLALSDLGIMHSMLQHHDMAEDFFGQALALAKDLNDPLCQAKILGNIGMHRLSELVSPFRLMGGSPNPREVRDAMNYFERALELALAIKERTPETRRLEAGLLANIACCHNMLAQVTGDPIHYKYQVPNLERALRIEQELGDLPTLAAHLVNLSMAVMMLGDIATAARHLQEAARLFRSLGRRDDEQFALSLLHASIRATQKRGGSSSMAP